MTTNITTAQICDAEEIIRLVNEAYSVECGDSGVSFKNCNRWTDPVEEGLNMYAEDRILKAVYELTGEIIGVICYEIAEHSISFGPFAVKSSAQGQGVGKQLFMKIKEIANQLDKKYIEIFVVNHRSDIIPMYQKWGFKVSGESAYPNPAKLTRPAYFYIMRNYI